MSTQTLSGKKITLATIKSFIKRNPSRLMIMNLNDFDGQQDCVIETKDTGFRVAEIIPANIQAVAPS